MIATVTVATTIAHVDDAAEAAVEVAVADEVVVADEVAAAAVAAATNQVTHD